MNDINIIFCRKHYLLHYLSYFSTVSKCANTNLCIFLPRSIKDCFFLKAISYASPIRLLLPSNYHEYREWSIRAVHSHFSFALTVGVERLVRHRYHWVTFQLGYLFRWFLASTWKVGSLSDWFVGWSRYNLALVCWPLLIFQPTVIQFIFISIVELSKATDFCE